MIKLIDDLRDEFDYILLDCPAGIEQGFKNAIAGADRALVVTTPEVSAIRDADRIIGLLENQEIRDIQLIVNRVRMDMVRRGDMMSVDDVMDILAIPLMGTIPDDEAIVILPTRENLWQVRIRHPDKHIWTSAGGSWERRSLCMHRGRTGLFLHGFQDF